VNSIKVLITGGSGRVGKSVVQELEDAGYQIKIFDLEEPKNGKHEFIRGDLRNLDAVKEATRGVEAIIHLAAIPMDIPGEAKEIFEINIMGTFHVLEAAARNSVKRVVFASSVSAYGFIFWKKPITVDYFPIDEKHPCRPDDMYGLSKLIGEKLCYMYTKRYGICTICLRLATVWFPGEEITMSLLSSAQQPESDIDLPHRDMKWQYVDVRDAAQAFRLALEKKEVEHEVYNIGAADVCSDTDSLGLVKLYYPKVKFIHNEKEFLADRKRALFDISKARMELGYKPKFNWRCHVELNIYKR